MTDEKPAIGGGQRSPAYPQYGLRRALEMIGSIYAGAHRAEISNDAAAGLMGYRSMSGPATAAIGAVKQFGLLEGRDPRLKVTALALSILEPMDGAERIESLWTAANMPIPFSELLREFGKKKPAENVLRSIAVRRFGFSGSGADKFVSVYLDTLSFLEGEGAIAPERSLPADATPSAVRPERQEASQDVGRLPDISAVSKPIGLPEGERLEFRLSPESRAVVVFSGTVTQEAVAKLASILNLVKDTFPPEVVSGDL
jgi:hypothetical protein